MDSGASVDQPSRQTERRRNVEKVLRDAEDALGPIAASLREMYWLVDVERMRALYVSPAFERIWDRPRASVYDDLGPFWESLHPDDRIDDPAARRELLVSGERQFRIVREDGSTRWIRARFVPGRTEGSRPREAIGVFEDVTETVQARESLRIAAQHDSVTGLPNRDSFLRRLGRSLERLVHQPRSGCAILFIDVDGFKVVNNSLGYGEGNRLLEALGKRLIECVRPEDMVARLGSDEFAVMLHNTAHATDAARVAGRILEVLESSFRLGGEAVYITASIGIVTGAGYRVAEEMVRDADIATARAKSRGPGTFRIFDPAMHAEAVSRLREETDLRHAVERDEFRLSYQPIFGLPDRSLFGFEALVRWQHPTRGLVIAREFVPSAERMGLIRSIGRWVLTEACRQMMEWSGAHPRMEGCTVNVNLSARQIAQPEIVSQVGEALETTGLPGERLALEITETALLAHSEAALVRLAELKRLGVRLHLDDFGTGYSALSYLSRLPVDAMKIDRSFIQAIGRSRGAEIVRAIRDLGKVLEMDVIAEGVESAAQLETLDEIGCDYAQGYLLGGPLDVPDVAPFVFDPIRES